MLNLESFENKFEEGWWQKLSPFFVTKEAEEIYKTLKERSRGGARILPTQENTFRAFKECRYSNLRVVMIGMEPYASMTKGVPQADGLAFSCSLTGHLQPSLEKLYEGIESDCYNGLGLNMVKDPDLSYLAHQGVLLLNSSLTVEERKIGSGGKLWYPFFDYLFNVLNSYNPGLVYILLGKDAEKVSRYVMPLGNYMLGATHPSYAARTHSDWEHNNVFSKTNKILQQNNGVTICWDKEEVNNIINEVPF